jgi:hypothetical protein
MKSISSRFRLFAVVACLTLWAGAALAGPLVYVVPSISPDPVLNLSTYEDWSTNALIALQDGTTTNGAAGPSYYAQIASFAATDVIGTNFPYWKGELNPIGLFAGQTGNGLAFGTAIYGNGQQFSMDNVSYADNFFGHPFSANLSAYGYGPRMVGINYGPDGIRGTADDVVYNTPGNASSLVDALFFSGVDIQFFVANSADLPAAIAGIQDATTPYASATYTVRIGDSSTSGSDQVEMVPEPATLSLAGLGVLLLGFAARRKR